MLLDGGEYRLLRDTAPWKYLGFVVGGTFMIFTLMSLADGRLRLMRLAMALLVTVIMALLYDLPFDDLQLPPNGDV